MSHRHDDSDPIEHDPTGMRALLGGLPDPGPMPDDLVARIEAAVRADLAVVDVAADGSAADGPSDADAPVRPGGSGDAGGASTSVADGGLAPVVPLHRRTLWRAGAVAAAAVVAVGLGGLALQAFSPGGVSASLGVVESGTADDAGSTAGGSDETSASGTDAGAGAPRTTVELVEADPDALVRVVASAASVTPDDLATPAGLLAVPAYDEFPVVAAEDGAASGDGAAGTLADPVRARACATSLGVADTDEVVVDLVAVGDVEDAALVVATDAAGSRTVWAVRADCGTADTSADVVTIAGPVAVG